MITPTPPPGTSDLLRQLAENPELLTAAHVAIEDHLIMMRDMCAMTGPHANGFVVREEDGSPSEIIRLGTRKGIVMALRAMAAHIDKED